MNLDSEALREAINARMPYGKHQGQRLLTLPEPYLVWMHRQGFPTTKLGRQLALIYEVKLNGLEAMLQPLLEQDRATSTRNLPTI